MICEKNNIYSLWILLCVLLLLMLHSTAQITRSSSCESKCGEIEIPYPFGIGKGCYLNSWYEVNCTSDRVLLLTAINREAINISLPTFSYDQIPSYGSIRVKNTISSLGCSRNESELGATLNLTGSPFFFDKGNRVIAVGCNNKASVTNVEPKMVGCVSTCGIRNSSQHIPLFNNISCNNEDCDLSRFQDERMCNGYRCCQTMLPGGFYQVLGVKLESSNGNTTKTEDCGVGFLADEAYSLSNLTDPQVFLDKGYSPVTLGWFIRTDDLSFVQSLGCKTTEEFRYHNTGSCACDNSTETGVSYASCACTPGNRGNPYLLGDCKGRLVVIQCHIISPFSGVGVGSGALIFVAATYLLRKFAREQSVSIQKRKFFKRNGGILLTKQLNTTIGNLEKTQIFTSNTLGKATENFSVNRVLGQGGQGTVYKGMLVDGRIVAVKKAKAIDEDKLEEFINEMVILSQINHRNIVKLLGCCLETDVPVLVYEFIPNGNLYEHLHGDDKSDDHLIATWENRLRIAMEIAGALAYLHSCASSPIYHRDIKSTNIMLDEKYQAKVADFGTSRSITIDQTHLTTLVSGTVGYVDPEYYQSSQYTEKSDVYSFGVVLVELLTGEKPVSFSMFQQNRTLASHFMSAMRENKLLDLIDVRIKDDCKMEQVIATANIAWRCLNLEGNKRPTMREVSMELERIRSSSSKDSQQRVYMIKGQEDDDIMEVNRGLKAWNLPFSRTTSSQHDDASSSSFDVEPLFPRRT